MTEWTFVQHKMDKQEIQFCRLVCWVEDHLFEPVNDDLLETFKKDFQLDKAFLYFGSLGMFSIEEASKYDGNYIVYNTGDNSTTFCIQYMICVHVSSEGKLSYDEEVEC